MPALAFFALRRRSRAKRGKIAMLCCAWLWRMRLSCSRKATSGTGSAGAGPTGAGELGWRGPRSGCAGIPLSAFGGVVQVRALVREMDESLREFTRERRKKLVALRGRWGAGEGHRRGPRRGHPGSPLPADEGVAQAGALVREMDESSTRAYERKAHNCVGAPGQTGGLTKAAGAGCAQVVLEALYVRSEGLHRAELSYVRWTRVLRETTRERRIILLVVVTK